MPRTAIALVGFELGLALAYLAMIYLRGKAVPLLDLHGLRSLPSSLKAAHLFAIGGLLYGIARFMPQALNPPLRLPHRP